MKPLPFLRAHRYEIIALIDGAIIMMLELVGARLIAPYLGTSIYVWTAIIGVILGSLAFGYWYGGKLADKGADHIILVRIMIIAAVVLMIALFIQTPLLQLLSGANVDLRLQALFASLLLFAPAAVFMGMVSPYLAKLKLKTLDTVGRSVGALYAAGTAGSIIGTFAAGYWLIAYFGSRSLGWSLVIALLLLSFLVHRKVYLGYRLGLVIAVFVLASVAPTPSLQNATLLHDADSAYARYQVLQSGTLNYLIMDNQGVQSGTDTADPLRPVFDYTERFVEAAEVSTEPEDVLMIGGGTFTVPSILSERFPNASIDVVEIDPALTRIAKDYFSFEYKDNIQIINQDGRLFLNKNQKKYDFIFMDAYSALTPPFQLTTQEAVKRLQESLKPDGVVVANIVATPQGKSSEFAKAQFATYADVFPAVDWYQATEGARLNGRQNIILIASDRRDNYTQIRDEFERLAIPHTNGQRSAILTDDYAPVERLTTRY